MTVLLPVTVCAAQSLTSCLLFSCPYVSTVHEAGVKMLLVMDDVCDPGSVCVLCSGVSFSEPGDPSRGYLYSLKGGEKVGMWEGMGRGRDFLKRQEFITFFLFFSENVIDVYVFMVLLLFRFSAVVVQVGLFRCEWVIM